MSEPELIAVSKELTLWDVYSEPDVICRGPHGAVAYFKSYAEGPTSYASFGDPYWKQTSSDPEEWTVFFPTYGGGCTYREWAGVIIQEGKVCKTFIYSEDQTCPSPQAPIKNSVLRYKILNAGAAFKIGDYLTDINDNDTGGVFATWQVTETFGYAYVDDNGQPKILDGCVKSVKLIDGSSDYYVGRQCVLGKNENSDFPHPDRIPCVIEVTAVTDAEYT